MGHPDRRAYPTLPSPTPATPSSRARTGPLNASKAEARLDMATLLLGLLFVRGRIGFGLRPGLRNLGLCLKCACLSWTSIRATKEICVSGGPPGGPPGAGPLVLACADGQIWDSASKKCI